MGDASTTGSSQSERSCNHPWPDALGHFSIQPEDLDGREVVTTVRTATDGELSVEFKATIHMEMSAFQKLAEKN